MDKEIDPLIPMTENELRASLVLMAATTAFIVISMQKGDTPEGQRMKIEKEAEKLITIAKERNRDKANDG